MFLLLACKKQTDLDCFTSNGSEKTEVRQVGAFNSIDVVDKIDVMIYSGNEYKVEVTCGDHIIKNIITTVEDGTLKLQNINTCNFVRGYKRTIKASITLPYLKFLRNEGVGTSRLADNFVQDTVVVRAESSGDIYVGGTFNQIRTSSHGNGDIYLNGSANSLDVYMFGINFLHAESLNVKDFIFVETYSIGDCYVNTQNTGQLAYNIWDQGNIYYTGHPSAIVNVSHDQGTGRAIQK